MTRMELAYEGSPILKQFLPPEKLIGYYCPHDFSEKLPDIDKKTQKTSEHGITVGCMGITCRMCWNKEVEDDAD